MIDSKEYKDGYNDAIDDVFKRLSHLTEQYHDASDSYTTDELKLILSVLSCIINDLISCFSICTIDLGAIYAKESDSQQEEE
jgi:hypothetical protein